MLKSEICLSRGVNYNKIREHVVIKVLKYYRKKISFEIRPFSKIIAENAFVAFRREPKDV